MKQELTKQFMGRDDTFWGVVFIADRTGEEFTTWQEARAAGVEDGYSEFKGIGFSGTQCTGYATRVQEKLEAGRVKVMGFHCEDNPTAGIVSICDGHDFAVVDGRYIVDPWLVEVETGEIATHKTAFDESLTLNLKGQGVFDMEDPADKELVAKVYGNPIYWREMDSVTQVREGEEQHYIKVAITATITTHIHTERGESIEDFCKRNVNLHLCEPINVNHEGTTWLGNDSCEIKVIEVKK